MRISVILLLIYFLGSCNSDHESHVNNRSNEKEVNSYLPDELSSIVFSILSKDTIEMSGLNQYNFNLKISFPLIELSNDFINELTVKIKDENVTNTEIGEIIYAIQRSSNLNIFLDKSFKIVPSIKDSKITITEEIFVLGRIAGSNRIIVFNEMSVAPDWGAGYLYIFSVSKNGFLEIEQRRKLFIS